MDSKFWHYEQCKGGTKECPHCGKKMIVEWDNMVMMSNPPQRRWGWWCGGCDHRELAGIHVEESAEAKKKRQWEEAQD